MSEEQRVQEVHDRARRLRANGLELYADPLPSVVPLLERFPWLVAGLAGLFAPLAYVAALGLLRRRRRG